MASGPITSWQIGVETMGTDRLCFLVLQNHADGDYCHEIKRHLLLRRKAMPKLDSGLKCRDSALLTEVRAVFSSSHVWM